VTDYAEAAIIKAAFSVISTACAAGTLRPDPLDAASRFAPVRLLENRRDLFSYGVGALVVSGFPVRPKDYPSHTEEVFADVYICPVFALEETTANSKLVVTAFFHEVRKLLNANANVPLCDPATPTRHVADAVLDLDLRATLFPMNQGSFLGVRIPEIVARYRGIIDVQTGDFV
jgi:hypothetical protein